MKIHGTLMAAIAVFVTSLSACTAKPQGIDATREACDAGTASACATLGYAYEAGKEVPRDLLRASVLFSQACDGGDALACWSLGTYYEQGTVIAGDMLKAAALYQKACDLGQGEGCAFLSQLYWQGNGVSRDPARARVLLDKACALDSPSCEPMRQVQQ